MPNDDESLPTREIRDPRALRALTSPVRLRILERLYLDGPLTATELSEPVGESPANCSWHLRQLARYGFVEEAGGGKGRRRPWRAVSENLTWGTDEEAGELAAAGVAASQLLRDQAAGALKEWAVWRREEPTEWRNAGFDMQTLAWLTVEELAEFARVIAELMTRHDERTHDPSKRPAGARAIRLVASGIPAAPLPQQQTDPPPEQT